jgi:hypothetical protein
LIDGSKAVPCRHVSRRSDIVGGVGADADTIAGRTPGNQEEGGKRQRRQKESEGRGNGGDFSRHMGRTVAIVPVR